LPGGDHVEISAIRKRGRVVAIVVTGKVAMKPDAESMYRHPEATASAERPTYMQARNGPIIEDR
jgi:hypothetical protein